jgi:hypothetical protein
MVEDDDLGNDDSTVNGGHWRGRQRQVMMVDAGVDGGWWQG